MPLLTIKKGLYIGLCLGFYAFGGEVFSQLPSKPQSLMSPNAAAFGLYGGYEVSHYTGAPAISIPLHTLESVQVGTPISLGYHASGRSEERRGGNECVSKW